MFLFNFPGSIIIYIFLLLVKLFEIGFSIGTYHREMLILFSLYYHIPLTNLFMLIPDFAFFRHISAFWSSTSEFHDTYHSEYICIIRCSSSDLQTTTK